LLVGVGSYLWNDVPGQQFFDAVDRMLSDTLDDVAQVCFGIQAVEFCRTD
jgi:hypothetical protein